MYNCPTFFLFWKCLDDMSYWTNLYRTVADNQLHFFTISNLNYTVFVSLAHMKSKANRRQLPQLLCTHTKFSDDTDVLVLLVYRCKKSETVDALRR